MRRPARTALILAVLAMVTPAHVAGRTFERVLSAEEIYLILDFIEAIRAICPRYTRVDDAKADAVADSFMQQGLREHGRQGMRNAISRAKTNTYDKIEAEGPRQWCERQRRDLPDMGIFPR